MASLNMSWLKMSSMRFCVGLSKVHGSAFFLRVLESTTSAWKRVVRPLLQLTMRCYVFKSGQAL